MWLGEGVQGRVFMADVAVDVEARKDWREWEWQEGKEVHVRHGDMPEAFFLVLLL